MRRVGKGIEGAAIALRPEARSGRGAPTRRRGILLGFGLLLAAALSVGTAGIAEATSLPVPHWAQVQSQWCWAASSQSVLTYYGVATHDTQCTIVSKAKNGLCPNESGSFYGDLDEIYNAYGRSPGTKVPWFVNFATIKSRVDAGRPLQIRYGYWSTNGVTGHIVTIYGYSGTSTVYRIDPAGGVSKSSSWDYLSYNSTWRTTHSRYNQGI